MARVGYAAPAPRGRSRSAERVLDPPRLFAVIVVRSTSLPGAADRGPVREVIVVGQIDLDRARRDAKALLRAARAGEVVLRADRAPALADAQRAVAVELGYSSWPALVAGVRGSALLAAAEAGRASEVY